MKAKVLAVLPGLAVSVFSLCFSPQVLAADAAAAEALAKKESCLKCHAVDRKKDAISLKDIAKKHAGKPDAEAIILAQITTGPKIKLEDGTEEEHKTIKTKDKTEVSNMIRWILSLK